MAFKERWARRQQPSPRNGVQICEHEEAFEGVTAQQIWDVLWPPEVAMLLDRTCVRAGSEPGPDGVGEVRCFVRLVNRREVTSQIEVMEDREPEYARTRQLGASMPTQRLFVIKPSSDGMRSAWFRASTCRPT